MISKLLNKHHVNMSASFVPAIPLHSPFPHDGMLLKSKGRLSTLQRPVAQMKQPLSDPFNSSTTNIRAKLHALENRLNSAVRTQDFSAAARYRDEITILRASDPSLSLRDNLSAAIAAEDYILAARLRDELAALTESLSRDKSTARINRILFLSARTTSDKKPVLQLGTVAPDGLDRITFSPPDPTGSAQTIYLQPTWSPSGDFIAVTEISFTIRRNPGGLFAASAETQSRVIVFDAFNAKMVTSCVTEKPPFFFYWSPCGTRLSLLSSELSGRKSAGLYSMQVVAPKGGLGATVGSLKGPIVSGRPFLYSFCPRDPGRVVAHMGDKKVVAIVSLDGKGVRTLTNNAGSFGVPQWHPMQRSDGGECVLFVEVEDESTENVEGHSEEKEKKQDVAEEVEDTTPTTIQTLASAPGVSVLLVGKKKDYSELENGMTKTQRLVMCDVESGERRMLCRFGGVLAFGLSPDGKRLTTMVTNPLSGREELTIRRGDFSPDLVGSSEQPVSRPDIDMFDTDIVLSTPTTRVLAFFWSPDSTMLLFLTTIRGDATGAVQWRVFNTKNNRVTKFAKFLPSGVFLTNYLTFFDQFVASGCGPWSPESNAFVYPGRPYEENSAKDGKAIENKSQETKHAAWVQYIPDISDPDVEPRPPELIVDNIEYASWSPC
eukprot:Plantae.Rhodophyta-Hildenbrandia_rubra.ctg6015.p1 GENE.Plantae.Rhodophyta-Hildenbrandia_rubra.ctg6015~~Plantae.Rhodophyta-Hildenbrandia_rubra.ctg6015.p1  ORF type:complete len:661 (-),score=73.42 Plantae.Rhodophyta-Hildenbrandia_rubra.ctg6015:534-2516(-)